MNNTKSKAGRKLNDLTGMTFGQLTVISRANSQKRSTYYNCQCSCGNTCVKAAKDLISGDTKSCGCLNSSKTRSVECVTTGVIYSSMSAAARATNCNVSAIHSCCNGKLHSTNDLEWRYVNKPATTAPAVQTAQPSTPIAKVVPNTAPANNATPSIKITSPMTIINQIATIDTQIKELQIKKRDLQNQLIVQKKEEIIQACIASDRSFDEIIELLRSDKKE